MSEKRRITLMLILVGILISANLVNWLSQDGDSGLFFAGLDSPEWSPALARRMSDIEATTELNFRTRKGDSEDESGEGRNPFIFGIDRQKERAQQERMAELAAARERMMAETRARQVAESEAAEPPQARFDGRIIGIMEDLGAQRTMLAIMLADEYHVVGPGDDLAQRYKLLSVTDEQAVFLSLAESQEIEVALPIQ